MRTLTTLVANVRWFAFGLALGSCLFLAVAGHAYISAGTIGLFAMLAALASAVFVVLGPVGRCQR